MKKQSKKKTSVGKMRRVRRVTHANFRVKPGQSLVIDLGMLGYGLNRIIASNKGPFLKVEASGHSRFELGYKKDTDNNYFWLSSLKTDLMLEDIVESMFWGQFTWGELGAYQKNKKFRKKVKRQIKKLVAEFIENAATKLNKIKRPSH